jgi:FAD:protein FMN transferase
MESLTFKGIGTSWYISADADIISEGTQLLIREYVADFERRFSRFLPDSEVNAFRKAEAGVYTISAELAILLDEADRLRRLTKGTYDPAVGELLEKAGYNATYTLEPDKSTESFVLPEWTLENDQLTISGPIAFDLGGIGKGYCIDRVSDMLIEHGYFHILVEAGGDMYATSRSDDSPWRIALQYPGRPDTAAGMIELYNRAVAVSDVFRRRWGKWHHVVDPKRRRAIEHIIGAVAVAPCAWYADCMTSVLFLGNQDAYSEAAQVYDAAYLVFHEDETSLVSKNWKGELF